MTSTKQKQTQYKNRYDDVFTFTYTKENSILWEGNFQYCRFGFPNDYTKAYNAYLEDHKHLDEEQVFGLKEFKRVVHEYQGGSYLYPEYVKLVESLKDEINMIDPSGGPYISRGMLMDSFGFKGCKVKDFKRVSNGYEIIVDKK